MAYEPTNEELKAKLIQLAIVVDDVTGNKFCRICGEVPAMKGMPIYHTKNCMMKDIDNEHAAHGA